MYKYFAGINTLDELKAAYRRLVLKYHPDRGGDLETMKAINAEHDRLFEELKKSHNSNADEYHQTTETAAEFRGIIEKLMHIGGDLTIELCGSWLWISGDTRPCKDELKAAGCRWSKNKNMWYWHHPEEGCKWHRGRRTIDQIRSKYGSQVIDSTGREAVTAYA